MTAGAKHQVEIIHPPSLKDRIFGAPPSEIDFSAVDSVIDNLGQDFVNRLPKELEIIGHALVSLEKNPDDSARASILFRHVHDLKGQAGTFDYNLISIIGNDLCRFIERPIPWTPRRLKVANFHVEAMKTVAKQRLTGLGGEHGQKMVDTLHSLSQKVLQEEIPLPKKGD